MDEAALWRAAYLISLGATNPSGIAHCIVDAVAYLRGRGEDPLSHPAVRVMIGQLAFLVGLTLGPSVEDLEEVSRRHAALVTAN